MVSDVHGQNEQNYLRFVWVYACEKLSIESFNNHKTACMHDVLSELHLNSNRMPSAHAVELSLLIVVVCTVNSFNIIMYDLANKCTTPCNL